MKQTILKINKTKSWFFEKINKIDKSLARLIKKKREKNQINKIRNEKGEVTIENAEIQRIIRDYYEQFSSVQLLSHVRLIATPRTAARQASLSITNSQSLLKLTSIELVMSSNHLILCRPLLLTPSILSRIRIFSDESVLCIRWPKYWSFSFSIRPFNEYSGLISFRMDWISLQSKGLSRVFSNTIVEKHQFFGAQLSL